MANVLLKHLIFWSLLIQWLCHICLYTINLFRINLFLQLSELSFNFVSKRHENTFQGNDSSTLHKRKILLVLLKCKISCLFFPNDWCIQFLHYVLTSLLIPLWHNNQHLCESFHSLAISWRNWHNQHNTLPQLSRRNLKQIREITFTNPIHTCGNFFSF